MAAPLLQEASIKVRNKIVLSFDQALDTDVHPDLTVFSVNYGKVPLKHWEYLNTSQIVLTTLRDYGTKDKLEINYQPPDDLEKALRAPCPDNANAVILRRNAVRAFYKVPVLNQLVQNETAWNQNANLGVNDDGPISRGAGGSEAEIAGWDSRCNGLDGGRENAANYVTDPRTGERTYVGSTASGTDPNSAGYGPYPISPRPNPRTATPSDFVLAYGLKEAVQLSNLDNADATQPNDDRIWMAIQDASALIDNYIVQASRGGKLLISSNRRRTALAIARYYLDSVRRREDVKQDYERCITEIERAMSMDNVVRPDAPWWQDPCNPWRNNGVRSHRIPQYYNGVTGKGLSGWWTDSGAIERNDWRYMRLNSEQNNNEPNRRSGVNKDDAPFFPVQPADDGGRNYSYSGGSSG